MKKVMMSFAIGILFLMFSLNVSAQYIDGKYSIFPKWGSSALELRQPMTFKSGTCIKLKIGGSASKVLVRFLRLGDSADDPIGILGGIRNVPKTGIITIKLTELYPNIIQISVHGNPKPWDFDLGSKNGPAKLESVTIVPCE